MTKQELLKKKKAVLKKVYGSKGYTPGMHKFKLENGVCEFCNTFIGDAKFLLCNIITPDEVKQFRSYDDR